MASKQFDVRIVNARKVSFAIMSCDVAIGYRNENDEFVGLFTVPDFILKKNDKGYFYSEPSKPYIKNGEHQIDDNGYKKYLKFFKLYEEPGADQNDPSRSAPTKSAFEARKWLIGLMVEAMKSIGISDSAAPTTTAKRAAAPAPRAKGPTAKAKPAAATATIQEEEVPAPGMDDEDDDLPF